MIRWLLPVALEGNNLKQYAGDKNSLAERIMVAGRIGQAP
jgi:hypothetical protein